MKIITLSFLIIILITGNTYGMKRRHELISYDIHGKKRSYDNNVKHQENQTKFILYTFLPEDVQKLIISFYTNRSFIRQPKIATQTIRDFYYTNKKYYALINDPKFSSQLINKLAYQFYCSHETIANFLDTKESNRRLDLQYELLCICTRSALRYHTSKQKILKSLIKNGVDLEFSYNHLSSQKTALMFCITRYNNAFNYLLKVSNINAKTPHGLTALHLSVGITPLYPFHSHEICQYPHVKINQQNNRGETALLYSLIKRKGYRIGNLFIDTIKELLKKGADPELGNKYGLTPLMAAKDLGNNDIISLIEQAIQDKQSVIPASVIKSPL